MQELQLADDLFAPLNEGSKTATVRSGALTIIPGPLDFVGVTDTTLRRTVTVEEVRVKQVTDVTDEEAQRDGAPNAAALFRQLKRRFYPRLAWNDLVTVVLHTPPIGG